MTQAAKTLLVTGGSRGIGAAICRLAAASGYRVAVNYVANPAAAEAVVREIESNGGEALAIQADVAHESDILAMFEAVDKRFGRLDALVNNAGIVDRKARVDEMDLARFERMMRINVIGTMLCAREAVKRMSLRHGGQGGAIVNISSIAAVLGSAGEYVDYAASKAAVDTFTIGLAREVAEEGIRVNAVAPNFVESPTYFPEDLLADPQKRAKIESNIPLGRLGKPEEVGELIAFLAGADAGFMTGQVVPVAGGWA